MNYMSKNYNPEVKKAKSHALRKGYMGIEGEKSNAKEYLHQRKQAELRKNIDIKPKHHG